MGLDNVIAEALPDVITTRLDSLVNWARKSSLWPATFGLACCAIEMMATTDARHDLARFGSEAFRARPPQGRVVVRAARRRDDPVGPRLAQDGARAAAHLRPDAGAEVGHLDGRVRHVGRRLRQL